MRIIITGSPGTGKSTVARLVSKRLGLELIDIKELVRQKRLCDKNHEVDLRALSSALSFLSKKKNNEKNYLVEGHLACEIKIPADIIFVLRTHPHFLEKRLAKRRYCRCKVLENMMAEMLDYCVQRVVRVYRKNPLELDTSHRSVSACVLEIEKAIKQKKKKLDDVNYSGQIKRYIL